MRFDNETCAGVFLQMKTVAALTRNARPPHPDEGFCERMAGTAERNLAEHRGVVALCEVSESEIEVQLVGMSMSTLFTKVFAKKCGTQD